ncbi:MAG: carbohydrate binding family 9 domain-containing protein, partial [Acidobacteriota bacterium]
GFFLEGPRKKRTPARWPVPLFVLLATAAMFGQVLSQTTPNQQNAPLRLQAVRVDVALEIDGRLDEEAWKNAPAAGGFVQQRPAEGQPATERTEVRVLFDRDHLYIGVKCFDSEPDKIVVTQSRRDGTLTDTASIQVLLDTYNDDQNGFIFGTNPLGIEYDGQVAREGRTGGTTGPANRSGGGGGGGGQGTGGAQRGNITGFNLNWDAVWRVRSRIADFGWETEIEIPFKTLRYSQRQTQTWGLNVSRNVRRKNEQTFWAPIPRSYEIYRVSMAGQLRTGDCSSAEPESDPVHFGRRPE